MRSFGEILKTQRQKLGITQKRVAESVGLSGAYICSLENGKRTPPPYHTVAAIADVLQLDVERLWNIAVKHREKWAMEKSRRKTKVRRGNQGADGDSLRSGDGMAVPEAQINSFFERPEVQMTTFGLFRKRPEEMTIEEKQAVYRAISSAGEFIKRTGGSENSP